MTSLHIFLSATANFALFYAANAYLPYVYPRLGREVDHEESVEDGFASSSLRHTRKEGLSDDISQQAQPSGESDAGETDDEVESFATFSHQLSQLIQGSNDDDENDDQQGPSFGQGTEQGPLRGPKKEMLQHLARLRQVLKEAESDK